MYMPRSTNLTQREEALRRALVSFAEARQRALLLLSMDPIRHSGMLRLSETLRAAHFDELDVLLQTPGGKIEAAYQVIKILRAHASTLNVIVPSYAKSAGTLICLGADMIMLGLTSELGPLDVQLPEEDGGPTAYKSALNGYKALEQIQHHAIKNLDAAINLLLRRTERRIPMVDVVRLAIEFSQTASAPLYSQIRPKAISEYARALEIGVSYGIKILVRYMGWEQARARRVISKLVYEYPSHGFIIDAYELRDLGLHVRAPTVREGALIEDLGSLMEKIKHVGGVRIELIGYPPATLLPMKWNKTRRSQSIEKPRN